MTDEEMAEKYFKGVCKDYNEEKERTGEYHYWVGFDIKNAYLAGFKAGRSKWHDLRKANDDLPLNTDPVLCLGSTGFIVCKYISGSWVDNQTIKLVPKYIDIYKWCEIEDIEE